MPDSLGLLPQVGHAELLASLRDPETSPRLREAQALPRQDQETPLVAGGARGESIEEEISTT